MITRFKNWWTVVPLLVVSAQLCSAQEPSSTFNFAFDNSIPIWDLTGNYHVALVNVDKFGNETPVEFDIAVTQDAQGQLSGTGESIVQIGDNFVAGAYDVRGSVRRVKGASVAELSVKISGQDTIAGRPNVAYDLSVEMGGAMDFDTNNHAILVGDSKINATFRGLGKLSGTSDVVLSLPGGMDGTWNLTLNVITLGKKLGGTAVITLSNNRGLAYDLSGRATSFNSGKVTLKGTNGNQPSHLKVEFDDSGASVDNGEALGQALK